MIYIFDIWGGAALKKRSGAAGFGRPDEMERAILAKARRNAYFFLLGALLAWALCESGRVYLYHTPLNLLPCGLLAGAMLVQEFSRLALLRSAVKEDEDSFESGPLLRLVALACAAATALATLGAAFLLMGVPQ